ncbi:MAG TPA: hypothetical protein VF027_00510 [Sphingomicrobium sp.]
MRRLFPHPRRPPPGFGEFTHSPDERPGTTECLPFHRLEIRMRGEEAEPAGAANGHSDDGLVRLDGETI